MVTLRPATMADAERLFAWRNDPLTKASSINTEPVPWDTHVAWLADSLACPNRELFICEEGGAPVGTIRLDRVNGAVELSWTIAPDHRRKGLCQRMVAAALPDAPCIARIRDDNIPSKKVAERNGFALSGKTGDMEEWRRSSGV